MRATVAAGLVLCALPVSAHAASGVVWTETIITGHADVLQTGDLVMAYNAYNSTTPVSRTVDGVFYAALPDTLLGGDWRHGGVANYCADCSGDFNVVMDGLIYMGTNAAGTISLGGLNVGQTYRLQLLMSNDINETGAQETWTLGGVEHTHDGWAVAARNELIMLTAEFTATSTTELLGVTGAPGGGAESHYRAVLNAFTVHAVDQDTDGDSYPDSTDLCPGVFDDQTDTDGDGFGDACAHPTANIDPTVEHWGSYIAARTTVGANVEIGAGTVIGRRADIGADAILGEGVTIARSATIGASANLGDDVIVGYGADVAGSTLGARTVVGSLVELTATSTIGADCVLARSVSITGSATLADGVIIGPETTLLDNVGIGAGARLRKNVDVRANVVIGDDARIGREVLLHDTAYVGNDAVLGAHVVVQPNACVDANLRVPRSDVVITPCPP